MKKLCTAFLIVSLLFAITSCEKEENSRVYFDYFDTWGTLYDYSGSSYKEFCTVADEVENILKEYNELADIYNVYEGKNNLATLNMNAGQGPVPIDEKLIDLIEYGIEIYHITNGETNIAFGAVLRIWHEYRESAENDPSFSLVPDVSVLSRAALHTDINDIVIDRDRGTVELLDSEMSLDVGAIAKGYAVEMVAKYLHGQDLNSYFFDMGGNLRAIGTEKDGSPFLAAVANSVNGGYAARFELSDEALVTSGSYVRFYTVDGVVYHHIIDKDTLFPKNDYVSVSINAPSSALADALSTAFFNMSISEAEAILGSLPEVSAVFVTAEGEVIKIGKPEPKFP